MMDRLHDYSELLYLLGEAKVYTKRLGEHVFSLELEGMICSLKELAKYYAEEQDARSKARSGKA